MKLDTHLRRGQALAAGVWVYFTLLSTACGGQSSAPSGAEGSGGHAGATVTTGAGGGATSGGAGTLLDFLGDPAYPDSFWEAASLESSGMDEALIESALDEIQSSGWEIHSFLIAREGRLVLERYGWNSGTNLEDPALPHQVVPSERRLAWSTTKSVLSALIGIALDEGLIASLEQPVASWFFDYESLNPSPEKASITLEDLLTMRSGLEFEEGDQTTLEAPDPARAMLSRPVVDLPVGEVWNYSTGGSDIIAEVLRLASGMTPLDYANQKLFGPLGIDQPEWAAGQNGTQHGGTGLLLTPREMLRFGELFRNRGSFLQTQVVPAAWTDASTEPRCPTDWGGQYAYHWWVPDLPGFFNALGHWGQVIYVGRELGLVIVFTGYLPDATANSIYQGLIRDFVVPAVQR